MKALIINFLNKEIKLAESNLEYLFGTEKRKIDESKRFFSEFENVKDYNYNLQYFRKIYAERVKDYLLKKNKIIEKNKEYVIARWDEDDNELSEVTERHTSSILFNDNSFKLIYRQKNVNGEHDFIKKTDNPYKISDGKKDDVFLLFRASFNFHLRPNIGLFFPFKGFFQ